MYLDCPTYGALSGPHGVIVRFDTYFCSNRTPNFLCKLSKTTQNAPVPSARRQRHRGSNHQLPAQSLRIAAATLLAQGEGLWLVIVAYGVVFVERQRRDAYYRNDPSKYGLTQSMMRNGIRTSRCKVQQVGEHFSRMRISISKHLRNFKNWREKHMAKKE